MKMIVINFKLLQILNDLAQRYFFQNLTGTADGIGNDNDQCLHGYLHLFNPSNTTFVKHFIANTTSNQ